METRKARRLNFVVTFIGFVDTPLLVPMIALYASSLGAEVAVVGMIVGVYSLTNTLSSVFGGRLVDRYGYRAPLLAGLVGDALSMFGYGLCRLPWHLGLVRAVHGMTGGIVGPATMSASAQTASRQSLGKGMALYGAAIGSATLIGNATGGIIATRLGYGYVFTIGGSLLAVAILLAAMMPRMPSHVPAGPSLKRQLEDVWRLLTDKRLVLPYASIFAQYFAFGGIVTLLPLHLERFGMSAFHVGMLIAAFALVFILVQLFCGGVSDRIGRIKPAAAGLGLAAVAVAMLPIFSAFPLMLAVMALFGLGYGLFFPALSALVADTTSPEEYGTASGIYHALLTVGVAAGAPIMGWLASSTGTTWGLAMSSLPLFVALALAIRALSTTRAVESRF